MARSSWWAAIIACASCAHVAPSEDRAPKWEGAQKQDASYALGHLSSIDVRLDQRGAPNRWNGPSVPWDRSVRDPYLFADRRNRIAQVRSMLPAPTSVADHLGEPALTLGLVDEELARVENESDDLARSSVDLLEPLLSSSLPDEWIAMRVDQVRDALTKNGVTTFERDELLLVMDSATRRGDLAAVALERLRAMLVHAVGVAHPLLDADAFDQRVAFLVRAWISPDSIVPTLVKTEATLRAQVQIAFSVLDANSRQNIENRASYALASSRPCHARSPVVTASDLAPPPERARICAHALQLSEAIDDEQEVASLLAMHEIVTFACQAFVMHRNKDFSCPKLVRYSPADEARETRWAANHPAQAISNALGVVLLVRDDPAHAPARARRWIRFGDAPLHALDLVTSGGG